MTETEMSAEIAEMLDSAGAFGAHHPDSRRMIGHRGFPDWVIAGNSGLQFWELKSESGTLSADQRAWGRLLRKAGATFLVVRPTDLHSGLVEAQINAVTIGGN